MVIFGEIVEHQVVDLAGAHELRRALGLSPQKPAPQPILTTRAHLIAP